MENKYKNIIIISENIDIEAMEAEKKVLTVMRDLEAKACEEYKKQFFLIKSKTDFKLKKNMCAITNVQRVVWL